jgi:hypothetical protein
MTDAAERGEVQKLAEWMNNGGEANAFDGDRSILMIASSKGHTTLVELLLDRGANINVQNAKGDTALMCACQAGGANILDIVLLLLKAGAKTDVVNRKGMTAVHLAKWNHPRVLEAITEHARRPKAISAALEATSAAPSQAKAWTGPLSEAELQRRQEHAGPHQFGASEFTLHYAGLSRTPDPATSDPCLLCACSLL